MNCDMLQMIPTLQGRLRDEDQAASDTIVEQCDHADARVIREKSVRLAIRTGWMPNLDLIWQTQEREGYRACFGAHVADCNPHCRWLESCQQVSEESIDSRLGQTTRVASFERR